MDLKTILWYKTSCSMEVDKMEILSHSEECDSQYNKRGLKTLAVVKIRSAKNCKRIYQNVGRN